MEIRAATKTNCLWENYYFVVMYTVLQIRGQQVFMKVKWWLSEKNWPWWKSGPQPKLTAYEKNYYFIIYILIVQIEGQKLDFIMFCVLIFSKGLLNFQFINKVRSLHFIKMYFL